jgi:hypothetical protein
MYNHDITGYRKFSRNDGEMAARQLLAELGRTEVAVLITLNGEDDATVSFLDEFIGTLLSLGSNIRTIIFSGFSQYTENSVLPSIAGARDIDLFVLTGNKTARVERRRRVKHDVETLPFDDLIRLMQG